MRPRISIRGFVRPSVRRSVGPSVRRSVRNALTKIVITARKLKETSGKHQGTHRIAFLVKIQENSEKFKKIQQFIGRIVVRIELVSSEF